MIEELEDFLRHCRVERRLAPLTCSAYERDVRACHAFLSGEAIGSWADVRPSDLRGFLAAEASSRPASASQARTVAALKGFFRFLVENEAIDRNPAAVLRTPKKREALPDVLDRAELERLLAAVERRRCMGAPLPGQARARSAAAGPLRLRGPAAFRAVGPRLGRRRARAPVAAGASRQGRTAARRAPPPRADSAASSSISPSARRSASQRSS